MEDVGRTLREAREKLGFTIEEVERATRIRTHHLEALERGDLGALPSPVQARGFLRNYADFLGLDVDDLMLRFADFLHAGAAPPRRQGATPVQNPAASVVRVGRPRWFTFDLFLAAGLSVAILALLLWGGSRLFDAASQGEQPAGGVELVESLTPTASATATALPPAADLLPAVLETPTPPPEEVHVVELPGNIITLRVVAEGRAWVRAAADGEEVFRGRVVPGDMLELQGEETVEVSTGNAAALHVFYNGQDQGTLGGFGEVVIRIWTLEGVITPTPTVTRTHTTVPPASATPVPSRTPRP